MLLRKTVTKRKTRTSTRVKKVLLYIFPSKREVLWPQEVSERKAGGELWLQVVKLLDPQFHISSKYGLPWSYIR